VASSGFYHVGEAAGAMNNWTIGDKQDDAVKAVEIRAELRQIKTMADGTINITLNLPEDCKQQVKVMLDWLGLEVKAVIAG
jgi:hypothetical protein